MCVLCETHQIWFEQVYSNISPSNVKEIGMQSGICAPSLDKLIVLKLEIIYAPRKPENVIEGGSVLLWLRVPTYPRLVSVMIRPKF